MQSWKKFFGFALLGVAAAGAGLFAGFLARTDSSDSQPPASRAAVAQLITAPLSTIEGARTSLGQWQDKTLVVNFWAAWCPPCREEMPGFSRLHTKYADKNFQFVGIAIDSADNVREFEKTNPVSYPLLIAGPESIEASKNLGNSTVALPFTVIISPDGSLRKARLGAISEAELESLLRP